jgi:hypothetical protein
MLAPEGVAELVEQAGGALGHKIPPHWRVRLTVGLYFGYNRLIVANRGRDGSTSHKRTSGRN